MKNNEKKKKESIQDLRKKSGEILKCLSFFFFFIHCTLTSSFQPAFFDSFLSFPCIGVQSCIFQSVGYYPKKTVRQNKAAEAAAAPGRSFVVICMNSALLTLRKGEDLLLEPQALPLLMLDPNPNCMFLMTVMVSIRSRYWFQTKKIFKKEKLCSP